jgi:hypothetical protein
LDRPPDVNKQPLDLPGQRFEKELGHVFGRVLVREIRVKKTLFMRLQLSGLGVWVHFDGCIV